MLVLLLSLLYFLVFLVRPGWGSIGWRLVWQFRVARSIHVALCVVYDRHVDCDVIILYIIC